MGGNRSYLSKAEASTIGSWNRRTAEDSAAGVSGVLSRLGLEPKALALRGRSCAWDFLINAAAYRNFEKSREVNPGNGTSSACTIHQCALFTRTVSVVSLELRSQFSFMSSRPKSAGHQGVCNDRWVVAPTVRLCLL